MQAAVIVVQEWVCRRVKGMENAQRIMLLLVKVYIKRKCSFSSEGDSHVFVEIFSVLIVCVTMSIGCY